MRRLTGSVCAALALAACGPTPARAPVAGVAASPATPSARRIEADRPPIEIGALSMPEPPAFDAEPEAVEFVPAVVIVGGEDQDLDEQIELRGRLLEGGISGVDRVEQWAVVGDLYTRKGDHQRAADSYDRAIRLAAFPSYPRADEVLFRRGQALRALGDLSGARAALFELIKKFPRSPWIADGYLAFGDHFAGAGAGDKARAFYEKAIQFGQSRTSSYAHYQLGWIHYRAGEYQRALEQFFLAVRGSLSTDVQKRIRAAAERGFVLAYVEIGLPARAFPALRRMSPDRTIQLAALLGDVYAARGDHTEAIEIYRALAADEHGEEMACEWQARIVAATVAGGIGKTLRDEVRRLGELGERGAACGELPRQVLGAVARSQLASARPGTDAARFAVEVGELYLRGYPSAPDAGELAYYVADRMWREAAGDRDAATAVQRWRDTAARFQQAVRLGGLGSAQAADAERAAEVAARNAEAAAAGR